MFNTSMVHAWNKLRTCIIQVKYMHNTYLIQDKNMTFACLCSTTPGPLPSPESCKCGSTTICSSSGQGVIGSQLGCNLGQYSACWKPWFCCSAICGRSAFRSFCSAACCWPLSIYANTSAGVLIQKQAEGNCKDVPTIHGRILCSLYLCWHFHGQGQPFPGTCHKQIISWKWYTLPCLQKPPNNRG